MLDSVVVKNVRIKGERKGKSPFARFTTNKSREYKKKGL
jgi:hypothetical protein